jgi:hypothetical protein
MVLSSFMRWAAPRVLHNNGRRHKLRSDDFVPGFFRKNADEIRRLHEKYRFFRDVQRVYSAIKS